MRRIMLTALAIAIDTLLPVNYCHPRNRDTNDDGASRATYDLFPMYTVCIQAADNWDKILTLIYREKRIV